MEEGREPHRESPANKNEQLEQLAHMVRSKSQIIGEIRIRSVWENLSLGILRGGERFESREEIRRFGCKASSPNSSTLKQRVPELRSMPFGKTELGCSRRFFAPAGRGRASRSNAAAANSREGRDCGRSAACTCAGASAGRHGSRGVLDLTRPDGTATDHTRPHSHRTVPRRIQTGPNQTSRAYTPGKSMMTMGR